MPYNIFHDYLDIKKKIEFTFMQREEDVLGFTSRQFLHAIEDRIEAEVHKAIEHSSKNLPEETYRDWNRLTQAGPLWYFIQDETHHALERTEWKDKWDGQKFVGLSEKDYEQMRQKVIGAFVDYAIDFFKECKPDKKGNWGELIPKDERNLRTSLKNLVI